MEYKDFVEQVKDQIQDFLPEKFADATISVHQVVKNNDCVLDGLTIRTEESNISPTVYLNPYFEQIQDGAEMDDVLGQIAATYQAHYIDQDMDVSAVTDFDNVKDKIVCKLINEEANRQFLEDKPYTKVEDLAVVYQILMDKNAEGTATITITDNLMDRYGIILEDLHEQALLNMDVLQSYSFKGMSETIIEMMAGDIANVSQSDYVFSLVKEALLEFVLLDTVIYSIISNIRDTKKNHKQQNMRRYYVLFKYDLEFVLSAITMHNLKDKEMYARIKFSVDINKILKEKRKKDVSEIDNLLTDISTNYYKIEILEQKIKVVLSRIIDLIE